MFRTIIYLFVFYANVSAWILLRISCCSYNQPNNEYEHCRCSQSVKGSNPVCNSHLGFLAVRIISRSIDRWQLALQNDEDRNTFNERWMIHDKKSLICNKKRSCQCTNFDFKVQISHFNSSGCWCCFLRIVRSSFSSMLWKYYACVYLVLSECIYIYLFKDILWINTL